MSDQESLLTFPCEFPLKVMGPAAADFDAHVIGIIRRHIPDLREGAVSTRASKGGRYLAVTVVITATSRAQLDAIYIDLNRSERVTMVL
ncbi:MAG: DUF493 domain-containing protein [Pseudomonadota bacterium]